MDIFKKEFFLKERHIYIIKMAHLLPQISVQEYKDYIDKQLNEYIEVQNVKSAQNSQNRQKDNTTLTPALLNERKRYSQGLRDIVLVPQMLMYVLLYDTRYIVKLVSQDFLTMVELSAGNPNAIKQATIHYLLMKIHWFNEFSASEKTSHAYQIIAECLPTNTNPHVTFFSVRYKVMIFAKFDIKLVIPQGLQLPYANQGPKYIICYGTGKESPDENYRMEIYLQTLAQLVMPDVTDGDKVSIFCNQLTNEITSADPVTGEAALQLDMHLLDDIRLLLDTNPQLVQERITAHLSGLRRMPNQMVGMELADRTSVMIQQLLELYHN